LLISVAVPVPNLDLLTYSVPPGVTSPVIGARVVVPLGSRVVTGIVIEVNVPDHAVRGTEIKPLRQVLDADAFVPPDVVALARWTAEYYAAGVGDTIPALLPRWRAGRAPMPTRRLASRRSRRRDSTRCRRGTVTDKQREALDLLAGTPTGIPTATLASRGISSDTVSRLAKHGHVSLRHDRLDRDPFEVGLESVLKSDSSTDSSQTRDNWRQLTGEQTAALERLRAIADRREFRVALLHGVTGSGKTEIYLRLAAAVRDARRRVLMLVPEIALTPRSRHSSATRSAIAWPSSTAASPTASGTISGSASGARTWTWSSALDRPSSRRSRTSA